jgi:N-acetylglutamate synthase-like GNAT family acetyltransferase
MPRQAAHIREAAPGDAEALLDLWSSAVRKGDTSGREVEDAQRALANLAANPDERLLVAELPEGIVAALHLSRGPLSPLVLETVVHTSFLLVRPALRRQGYGHALMEAAVAWAEEKDVSQITAVTDNNRDTNRFFARLGLSTFAHVRHASTPALRKKLSVERGRVGSHGNRHLMEVLAQRRSMRRRQTDG